MFIYFIYVTKFAPVYNVRKIRIICSAGYPYGIPILQG